MKFTAFDTYLASSPAGISYVEMFPSSNYIPAAPSFIYGTLPESLCTMMFAIGQCGRVGFYNIEKARVTRDLIPMHESTVLTGDRTNHPDYYCRAAMGRAAEGTMPANRRLQGLHISLGGPGLQTWGHWLVDFLPRLYLFQRLGWNMADIRWLLPAQAPAYVFEFLRLLGINSAAIVTYDQDRDVVEVDRLIVPENLTANIAMHPIFADVVRWMKSLLFHHPEMQPSAVRKFFISRRSNPGWRELRNRAELETMAQEYGYEIVEPTTMTVLQQVALFRSATHIAGEYGSGLHNSIFAPRNAVVTCFRGNGVAAGLLQNGLFQIAGQQFGYVIGDVEAGNSQEAYTVTLGNARMAFDAADRIKAMASDEH